MPWHLSAVVMVFTSLTVITKYGSPIRAVVLTDVTDEPPPMTAATAQTPAKSSILQITNQVPHKTLASRLMDNYITSQRAATTSNSENTRKTQATTFLATTKITPSTSPIMHTLVTNLPTSNTSYPAAQVNEATIGPNTSHTTVLVTEATISPNTSHTTSHTAASVTEATAGHITSHTAASVTNVTRINSSTIPGSRSHTVTTPEHTARTSPSNISHTTETTQPSNQTTLPATLSTSSHNSTSQEPTQSIHTLGPATAIHNATQTASPTTKAPGPTLSPQPSSAKTGIYQVFNGSRLCIKAEMGIELIVQDTASVFSPKRYFNIDPNVTHASGNCGFRKSDLLLNFQGGFVNFTFTKDENSYYISEVGAYLIVSNPEKTYKGMKSAVMMFETVVGHSFKCVSEQSIQLSDQLQLKTMNVQLQAFDFEGVSFGNVDECSSDYTIVLPVIGAIVLGLCAVGLIVYGIRLRRESSGYQRI
ncbi:PREDICTED: lysosome-associated membrane glycoprotein 3 [Condylura cristata]|uniref:lysosome-associated membrane glycoprotein 3 n=1 Tax=Condylura cristata TaxID=143302 RepID=UPI000642EC2B|nr:PREDICTED: lysosome-associated membrane glycoprotein 3 [Condylura cristata]